MEQVVDVLLPHPSQTPILPPRLVVLARDLNSALAFSDLIFVAVCHFLQLLTIFVAGQPCDSDIAGLFLCQFTTVWSPVGRI